MVENDARGASGYFKKLRVVAENWREAVRNDAELAADKLARKGSYVRLARDGYRLVSIRTENPCGSTGSKPVKSVEDVKGCIAIDSSGKPPGNKKPEQRVQAYLIHQSLVHTPESIARMLDPKGQLVDRLWFVADEIRLGDEKIRADMLFVGSKNQKMFPVLVELKANRSLGKVVEQLDNMDSAVKCSSIAFCDFLRSAVPETAGGLDFGALQKWIIWPAATRKARSLVAAAVDKDSALKVIEFCNPVVSVKFNVSGKKKAEKKIDTCFDFDAEPLKFDVVHA